MNWYKVRKQIIVVFDDGSSVTYTMAAKTDWKPYFERHVHHARVGLLKSMTLRAYPFKNNAPIDLIQADKEGRIDQI